MKHCNACRHYHPDPSANPPATGGECRRKAPRLAPDGAIYAQQDNAPYAYWPIVNRTHWCGDWQLRRKEE